MNNGLFRLIFNRRTGMLTPTWEGASAQGKASTTARACVLTLSLLFFAHPVLANPSGATVVNGTVGFNQSGNTLTITNSPNSIINWQSFSINKDEITRFIQQNSASAVLNRVTGQDPSKILGTLQSNGRVFLINPNGIVFGKGATIDVAGLVASTLKMSDADFLNGKHNFSDGAGAGSIKNEGTINTASGGQVYLIAPDITNNGIITSPKGEIVLAAGHSVSLVDPKNPEIVVSLTAPATQAVNVGQLISEGGSIGIYAGLVNQAGIVNANSASVDESGRIYLKGTQSTTLGAYSATSASNSAGNGGEITITSGESTVIAAGASIAADAGQNGNGGKVTVWSDGSTLFDGQISAQGGAQSGNGGFVETSAQHVSIGDTARVTTRAANGRSGTWLIDPSDFTIAASGGDISGATLSANLANNNVTIESSNGFNVMGNGDIHVNDAVSWSANDLTLTATRDININDVMTASGTSSLTLNTATANGADAAVAGGTVRVGFNPDGSFKGRVDFPGRSGTGFLTINDSAYTVINSLGAEGSITGTDLQGINGAPGARYALGANIDATASAAFNNGAGFAPISGFTGQFDGLGHTVSNLTINRPTQDGVGLFSNISGASIRNVGLINAVVVGLNSVGALVGSNFGGLITNSFATGTVGNGSGSTYVGGLVGFNNGGAIDSSHAAVTVDCSDGTTFCGGLVGNSAVGGMISNSYATGNVSGGAMSLAFGGLAGKSEDNSSISNSYATGTVSVGDGSAEVGGLVGFNLISTISASYATGAVSAGDSSQRIGGLAGVSNGTITNSYATGAVTGGDGAFSVGGLVGYNAGTLSVSNATGTVSVGNNAQEVGGLVGFNEGAVISGSYATGNVIAGNDAYSISAFVGGNDYGGSISNSYATGAVTAGINAIAVGGLVGDLSDTFGSNTISGSYATGAVSAGDNSQFLGGLAGGSAGAISDSYASGSVSSGANSMGLGGLVGGNSGTIDTSYSIGSVAGAGATRGGLVGANSGFVNNSYWNIETSGQAASAGGVGLTTAQMKRAANFAGFDFVTVWDIFEGTSFPYLRALFPNGVLIPATPMPMLPPLDHGLIAPERIGPIGGTSAHDFNVALLSHPPAAISDELYIDPSINGEDRNARLLCQ